MDDQKNFSDYKEKLQVAIKALPINLLARVVKAITDTYYRDGTIFTAGNGGSAATASHMACDFTKTTLGHKSSVTKKPLRTIALTDNAPLITAWGNDSSYDIIFSEQFKALARPGDMLIVISASGNSPNVIKLLQAAKQMNLITTIGLLGFDGGKAKSLVNLPIIVESRHYGVIEDSHSIVMHMLTENLKALF